ncbi:hypothetical protein CSA80_01335 [Candidatus Saccharibacteria bacterium]|nr:MAG: hypothetical protein CSA80_01335 [Candidatus Saccharibacteria bacterium]
MAGNRTSGRGGKGSGNPCEAQESALQREVIWTEILATSASGGDPTELLEQGEATTAQLYMAVRALRSRGTSDSSYASKSEAINADAKDSIEATEPAAGHNGTTPSHQPETPRVQYREGAML